MYVRGILIDPITETVSEMYIQPNLEGLKYALSIDPQFSGLVERVSVARSEDMWICEEGNLAPGRLVFSLGGHTFAGAAIILAHDDEGESVSSRLPLELIIGLVQWTNLETTGDFGEPREYVTEHPVLGKVPVYEGGKPIYQERV
jgi:hypothetical protein